MPENPFDSLSQLSTLRLNSNQLSSLEDGIFDNYLNLIFLDLSDNQLTSLPKINLDTLPRLQELPNFSSGGVLSLGSNKISDLGADLHQFLLPHNLDLRKSCFHLAFVPSQGFLQERDRLGKRTVVIENPLPDCPGATAIPITNTFTKSTEGWKLANNGFPNEPNLSTSGGNPDGHLSATDADANNSWSWRAPYYYYGDTSLYIGGSFSFSLKAATPERRPSISVTFVGAGQTINFNTGQAPSSSNWVEVSVPLSHTGWTEQGFPISEASFAAVMADLQDVRISGEYGLSTSGGSGSLDSVSFVGP